MTCEGRGVPEIWSAGLRGSGAVLERVWRAALGVPFRIGDVADGDWIATNDILGAADHECVQFD